MLFKQQHLIGIKAGEITLAFRKWKKASVKPGSLIHTSVGLIEIQNIVEIKKEKITDKEAKLADFIDRSNLLKSFPSETEGIIFKISLRYHSEDPRIALREQTDISDEKFIELKNKLEKLDKHSRKGPWTNKILLAIKEHPNLHAVGISTLTGFEKEWLKLNIRKLKNAGLTISHTVGYELSPLGKQFIRYFENKS
ncbi:hypothetical protein [Flavihumibacter sp. UBA7668]|uniref:hypothetical protein n=1 Tax=Flavihumibacter sp. UBA7668 TaxID=1946542 RepID=UPI0025C61700|nr:hypothetical protein [Flavihumibacter sp. UBA7668]